jgi:hypothetical protein
LKLAAIGDLGGDLLAVDIGDGGLDPAVVKQDPITVADTFDRHREADPLGGRGIARREDNLRARFKLNVAVDLGGSHLRPFEVNHQRERAVALGVDLPDAVDNGRSVLRRPVARVEPGDGHSRLVQRTNGLRVAGGWPERTDDFRVSHGLAYDRQLKKAPRSACQRHLPTTVWPVVTQPASDPSSASSSSSVSSGPSNGFVT